MTQTEDLAQFDPASFEHIPVLLNECLDGLNIDPAGTYLDGTAGGAGHSRQIALRLDGAKGGRLVSLDQDPDAVQTARARLAGLPATVVQINFRYAGQALESLGIVKINGDEVVLRGDGNLNVEHCRMSDVKGEAIGFYRKGRDKMDKTNGLKWIAYSLVWSLLLPVRRYLLAIYRRII